MSVFGVVAPPLLLSGAYEYFTERGHPQYFDHKIMNIELKIGARTYRALGTQKCTQPKHIY